jgi:ABC-type siderophore export system fused ATPase/permease subunit
MNLANADVRRGLRSVVQAIVVLAIIGLAFWLTELMRYDARGLREMARFALAIIALGTTFYGIENATRAFKVSVGIKGIEAESGADIAEKAGEIKQAAGEIEQAAKDQANG